MCTSTKGEAGGGEEEEEEEEEDDEDEDEEERIGRRATEERTEAREA
jgi:hypothetical protein